MSTQFCSDCNAILLRGGGSSLRCSACFKDVQKMPADTLVLQTDNTTNHHLLLHFQHDPVNPRAEKKCSKCDAKILVYILHGPKKTIIFGCEECGNIMTKDGKTKKEEKEN